MTVMQALAQGGGPTIRGSETRLRITRRNSRGEMADIAPKLTEQIQADDVIYVPKTPNFLQAVLGIIPLQLLAYRIARLRDLNVDQPRNLAKTVTVE